MEVELKPEVMPGGLKCSYYLTSFLNADGVERRNIGVCMMGQFVVTDTGRGTKNIRICSKYIHAKLGLALSIGWDVGAAFPGVSVGPTIVHTEDAVVLEFQTNSDYT